MYAKVIVDIAVKQVNRPFDYEIPSIFQESIEIGSRVIVPFANRLLQGFVVDIVKETDFDGEILSIHQPMDAEPVLSSEMIQLGQYMSQSYFAFLIQCFQTMLPPMLKTTSKKFFIKAQEVVSDEVKMLFLNQKEIEWTPELTLEQLSILMKAKKTDEVRVEYRVKNQVTIKTQPYIQLTLAPQVYLQYLDTISNRAKKQKTWLMTVSQQKKTLWAKKDFLHEFNLSEASLKNFEKNGWIKLVHQEVYRDPYAHQEFKPSTPLHLNTEQEHVYQEISKHWNQGQTFLLQGVTGSGKTEVYLHLIAKAIAQKQGALLLVPEISLTSQMVHRVKSRFGNRVAVLHSGLSVGEKYDEWRKIKQKEADIVVGVRSSIFAPLENIGIIILDEEHESSYKQEESPRYHAREIAKWRSKYHSCPLVLGSATPSLESRARAQKNVYTHLRLTQRAQSQHLPEVHLIDMRQEFMTQRKGSFSQRLQEAIADRLEKKEQVVLLQNRRGYSSFIMCRDCGYVLECPNCDISLTLHMDVRRMKCHYCGHEETIPHRCIRCGGKEIRYFGTGTQKVEEELTEIFPNARIIRMDVDTTRKKGEHEKLLTQFAHHEADILLGTQMIAKGLDFPNVTLVGVINADTSLHLPDFRSFEKTFQLLTQVAGRSGRANKKGEVFIQTFNPEHYVMQLVKHHDYEHFYALEMQTRHIGNYPPYYYTTMITISSEKEGKALQVATKIKQYFVDRLNKQSFLLGPSLKSIARMNNRFYFQILVKYKSDPALSILLNDVLHQSQAGDTKDVQIKIDVEPLYFL